MSAARERIVSLLPKLRKQLAAFRSSSEFSQGGSATVYTLNALVVAAALAELGAQCKRAITVEEEHWFNAAYHLNFELHGGPWQGLEELYLDLVDAVRSAAYFRLTQEGN